MKVLIYSKRDLVYPVLVLWLCSGLFVKCTNSSDRLDLSTPVSGVELFSPSQISSPLYERDLAIHPSEEVVIFSRGDFKQSRRHLLGIKKNEEGWDEARILPFSGQYDDIEPFFSPDGLQLFFASDRPINGDTSRNDFNIWVIDYNDGSWGEAIPLSEPINTEGQEYFPSVSLNGNLYFTATRSEGIGREDIYVSELIDGKYESAYPLDTNINTSTFEFNATVSPEDDLIIFSSFGRQGSSGGGDLYMSKKDENGNWLPSQNLGEEINSPYLDYCPFIDIKNRRIYFTSERYAAPKERFTETEQINAFANQIHNGMGNIYVMSLNAIDQIKLTE